MATIKEILEMSNDARKKAYSASGIEKVTIDGIEFSDYGAFSFLWEKSYVKSPVRSGDGSIGNLNSYATFVTPHLKIDFSMMSIDSYRKLMLLLYSKNEFTVTCYDIVNNRMTTNRMYFATEEMPKLWSIARAINGEEWVEVIGVQEYTVEMIGTNASLEMVNVIYKDEDGNILLSQDGAIRGEDVLIQYDYTPSKSGFRFDGEWEYHNGMVRNGDVIKANTFSYSVGEIILTAKVIPTDEYKLGISYGNGHELYDRKTGNVISEITIRKGQTIQEAFANANIYLPSGEKLSFPKDGTGADEVIYEEKAYYPYVFNGWSWLPNDPNKQATVTENTIFNISKNAVIYQSYQPRIYSVSYYSNTDRVDFDSVYVKYGDTVSLPLPKVDGYVFGGWYLDNGTFQKKFDGKMLPFSFTIYARWDKA